MCDCRSVLSAWGLSGLQSIVHFTVVFAVKVPVDVVEALPMMLMRIDLPTMITGQPSVALPLWRYHRLHIMKTPHQGGMAHRWPRDGLCGPMLMVSEPKSMLQHPLRPSIMLKTIQQDLSFCVSDRDILASGGKIGGGDGAQRCRRCWPVGKRRSRWEMDLQKV